MPDDRVEVDHDLLIGLLAFQNGLIDGSELLSAFHDRLEGPDRPLDRVLLDRGTLSVEEHQLLAALVRRHLERHGGDASLSLAALGSTAESARALLQSLPNPDLQASLTRVGTATDNGSSAEATRTVTYQVSTRAAGDRRFRTLRPHARGGLGAVFVALDEELHREVALKEIQGRYASDDASRARFVREAEITGGLEHPGIVPVYGLGTYDDGRPFYAMRFIRGDSLKEAIAGFHNDPELKRHPGRRALALQKLLRRFLDVCDAIEYAHSRGVLHRDLKPGNIMVGKYGETLVVDWGLAKPTGQPADSTAASPALDASREERPLIPASASGSAETLPGSAVGTPGYMSPEQAAGRLDRLGPASDVYSLGATLYCLLTGRAPFEGTDLGEVLRKVQRGEFAPPRQVDRSIAPALEAICLKAMSLDPTGRYRSPRALADDLERWLADEPVLAHREPLVARLRRWRRRHRPMVAGALAALVVAVGALAFIAFERARRTEEARRQVEARSLDALAQARAGNTEEASARLAEAIGLCRREPALAAQGRRLAADLDALGRYRRFRRDASAALSFVPMGHGDAREIQAVVTKCQSALGVLGVLDNPAWLARLQATPLPPDRIEEVKDQVTELLSSLVIRMGYARSIEGRDPKDHAREGLRLIDLVEQVRPLSQAHWMLRGTFFETLDQPADAARAIRQVRALKPSTPRDFCLVGQIALSSRNLELARASYDQALAIEPNMYAAHLGRFLADSTIQPDNPSEALVHLTSCLTTREDPTLYYFRGMIYFGMKEYDRARLDFASSIRVDPTFPHGHFYRGRMLVMDNDWKAAETDFGEAARLVPSEASYRYWHAIACARNGRHREAAEAADRALDLDPDKGLTGYYAARAYAQAVDAVLQDDALDPAHRKALAQRYTDRCIEILANAVAHGFHDFDRLVPGSDFEPVRLDPRFAPIASGLPQSRVFGPE